MREPPADHPIRLYVSLPGFEVPVGSARSMAGVPKLLRAVADAWQRRLDGDFTSAEYDDGDTMCALRTIGWAECRVTCGDCYSPGSFCGDS